MDLSINLTNQNLVFKAKYTKFSKEQMDRVLLPMFHGDVEDLKVMCAQSGYTKNAIHNWFKKTFGMSVTKYANSAKNEALKKEMAEFYRLGVPMKDVAEYYGYSVTWVNSKYVEFGFKQNRVHIDEDEKEQILEHVRAGHGIKYIADKFKHPQTTIQKLISLNFKEGLVKFRYDNNIPLIHQQKDSELEEVELIKKCLDEGMSVKETAKSLGRTSQRVLLLMDKYDIKSKLDIAHELLDKLLPGMVEMKTKLGTMVKEIGLSAQTIRRRIKELYGKTYRDILSGR